MPKPLLISYADIAGGAARATYRLHNALRTDGVDSELAVCRKYSDDVTVTRRRGDTDRIWSLRSRMESYALRLQHTDNPTMHSLNFVPTGWSRRIDADIVNLHWIGGGAISIRDVGRIKPPVVLTLHDMWAFCGAEHYSPESDNARWKFGYTRRNRDDGHGRLDLDRWTWNRKRRHWSSMTVVTPSRWLADCVRSSALMSDWPVDVVPYPLDMTVFRPIDRSCARRALGLPQEGKLILFGAVGGTSDPRKGFDLLTGALQRIASDATTACVVFGQDAPTDPPRLGLPIHWMGPVNDDERLAQLYSAADVMVVPSRQDNLPQTGIEAQACGTPVVAFDTAGLPDVVAHEETGYLARPFSEEDLARGISWVVEASGRGADLCRAARNRAQRLWSPPTVAAAYRDVFETTIERHRAAE